MSVLLEALRRPTRCLLEEFALPIAAHDPAGRIVLANAAFAKLFDGDPATLVGRRIQEWIPEDQRDSHRRHLESWSRGEASVPELTLPCFGQRCLLLPAPIFDRAGRYLGVIVAFLPQAAATEALEAHLRAAAGLVEVALGDIERLMEPTRTIRPPTLEELSARDAALGALSEREREVAQRLVDGERSDEIARALEIRPNTVRNHLKAIFRKLGVGNQADLIARVRHTTRAPWPR